MAATHEFTVPAANTTTTFTMSTDYVVVLSYDQDVGIWFVEGEDSQDPGAAPGWSIATRARYKPGSGSWTASPIGAPLMIRVNGSSKGGTPPVTNNPPTVANPIDDQTATAGAAFNYTVPANTFNDTDAGDTLTYAATQSDDSGLPSWLSFDDATRTFSGTPATANVGTLEVTVTASDGIDSVGDTFDIVVSADTTTATCTGMCLVSNLNQLATTAFTFGSTVTRNLVAQGFMTGASTGGYTLTSIEVAFSSVQSATQLGNLTAGVWSDDGSGNPSAELFTLTKPASIVAATKSGGPITLSVTGNYAVFTAPANTTLDPSTSYHMVLEGGNSKLWSTAIDDETGATGWSIADVGHEKETAPTPGNWAAARDDNAASNAMLIRVNGAVSTNAAPTAANNTVTTGEDTAYAFTAADFGFVDTDTGDTLASVKIVTLPGLGTLALDGTAVMQNDAVDWDDIEDDKLTFRPALNAHGVAYTTFTFKVNDGTADSASAYTMTIDVTDSPAPVCTAPSFGDRREIWTGTVTVETLILFSSTRLHGFDAQGTFGVNAGALDNTTFSIGSNAHTVNQAFVYPAGDRGGDLQFTLNDSLSDAEHDALRLHVCDTPFDFSAGSPIAGAYDWTADLDWSDPVESRTLYLSLPENNDATGEPAISGTAQVGQELTATTGAIADDDGLPSSFTYQWVRVDADGASNEEDITGEIASTYTLTDDDEGKKVKVKVSFTDELNGKEERTSAAYPSSGTVTTAGTNTAPTAADNTVMMAQDTAYVFTANDFGFEDTDGDTLASVKIVTVPTPGELALDGTAVTVDDVVAKADIDDDKLTFTPVAGASGTSYASFDFKVNDGTDDSAGAYTMTIDVTSSGPAITIAADRPTATGKVDWVRYTLRREGDTAAALTVTVTFAGPADNDWSLDTSKTSQDVTFTAGNATAGKNIRLADGFGNIGFSSSATTSGTLTARLGAKTGYDTSDTDQVDVVVNIGPAWVIKLAEDAYRFTEDGGAQNIEMVATAASADMPAPSLHSDSRSVLRAALLTQALGTAHSPADFAALSLGRFFPVSTCSADPNAGNVQVCRFNVPFTPVDDAEAEPDETLNLVLQQSPSTASAIHFQGPGPDRTVERFRLRRPTPPPSSTTTSA